MSVIYPDCLMKFSTFTYILKKFFTINVGVVILLRNAKLNL